MSELKNIELSDKQIAFVMEKNNKDNKVGVYIPSVMSDIEMGDKVWTKKYTPSNKMIKNSNVSVKFQQVELTNVFEIEPKNISNISAPNLGMGEKVWVSFVDGDLKKCIYTDESVDETQRTTDSYSISVMARKSVKEDESKYEFNMDSDDQFIELKTSDKNGEKDELSLKMDGKEGEIKITTTDGYINIKGDTTDISSILCINGINIMDTLKALRNEMLGAMNQIVDQTNAVLNSTIDNVNASISSTVNKTNTSFSQVTNGANNCCSDLQNQINSLENKLSAAESDIDSLEGDVNNIEKDIDNMDYAIDKLSNRVGNLEYSLMSEPSLDILEPSLDKISYTKVTSGTVSAGSVGSVSVGKAEIGTLQYLLNNGVKPTGNAYQKYSESEYDENNSTIETSDRTDETVVADGEWHWPTNTKRITCGYLGYSGHYAIDIGVAYGPLYAANNGVVQTVQRKSTGYGWMIFINHQNGYYSRYAHLSEINVKVGDTVKKGQVIGKTGNTGNSTGPHLHFEIRTDTKSQPSYAPNPLSFYK